MKKLLIVSTLLVSLAVIALPSKAGKLPYVNQGACDGPSLTYTSVNTTTITLSCSYPGVNNFPVIPNTSSTGGVNEDSMHQCGDYEGLPTQWLVNGVKQDVPPSKAQCGNQINAAGAPPTE